MYKLITILLFPLILFGFNLDNRYPKEQNATFHDSLNMTLDIGYGIYLIDVTSSEINRAIDYRVLEATIGASYSIGKGNIGINTKALIKEKKSNMSYVHTHEGLNDSANIDRDDYSLFANYYLDDARRSIVNLVYKYYRLKATHQYKNVYDYDTHFNYTTQGLALSYIYNQPITYDGSKIVLGAGLLYSHANVEIFENINGERQDATIDDAQNALGVKLALGYLYRLDNLQFKVVLDWYYYDFGNLDVYSRAEQANFSKATLQESTYAIRFGYIHKF
ncbi:MAG: hypothetical protein U9N49_01710 [Campylobacterota bacterium]|nr:hypothetical protein [Campylobacterota bacterium]